MTGRADSMVFSAFVNPICNEFHSSAMEVCSKCKMGPGIFGNKSATSQSSTQGKIVEGVSGQSNAIIVKEGLEMEVAPFGQGVTYRHTEQEPSFEISDEVKVEVKEEGMVLLNENSQKGGAMRTHPLAQEEDSMLAIPEHMATDSNDYNDVVEEMRKKIFGPEVNIST